MNIFHSGVKKLSNFRSCNRNAKRQSMQTNQRGKQSINPSTYGGIIITEPNPINDKHMSCLAYALLGYSTL